MKKRIWNFFGIAVLTVVVGFSLIQLKTPVVRAEGCPSDPFPGCACNLISAEHLWVEGEWGYWWCTYSCVCSFGGGGEPMTIVRDLVVNGG